MSGWPAFWQWVVWASLVAYFGLAVILAVGGVFDLKTMFRRLNEARANRRQ